MDYRAFVKADRNTLILSEPGWRARRGWLRVLLLAGGFAILGVVLAKTQDHPAAESPRLEPATGKHDTQKTVADTQIIQPLALPSLNGPAAATRMAIIPIADLRAGPWKSPKEAAPPPFQHTTPPTDIPGNALPSERSPSKTAVALDAEPAKQSTDESEEHQVAMLTERPIPQQRAGEWHKVTIESGDTLSEIFNRLDIHSQLHPIMELGEKTELLNSIYPGQELRVRIGKEFQELFYEPNDYQRLHVEMTPEGLHAELLKQDYQLRQARASGVIHDSLFLASQQAGLSDAMIMELAAIFGWDIDFVQDIREGDRFFVLYEEHWRDGEKIGTGDILAAEFVNQGETYRAVRYENAEGRVRYYTPDGRSMRRPFMRNPVAFARISSHFDPNRRHPILNTIRAHNGVDYAAPTGTPVRAAGDGKVIHRGVYGGYGNCIILKHGTQYSTLYAHMSGYADNTSVGSHVEQGQTIGYVGSTGLATGPHLHFEFRINGVHRNPLTVELPPAEPLPESEMPAFTAAIEPLLAQLDAYSRSMLAAADQKPRDPEKTASTAN